MIGEVSVSVVELIVNVAVSEAARHSVTLGLSTGQWANSLRLLGRASDVLVFVEADATEGVADRRPVHNTDAARIAARRMGLLFAIRSPTRTDDRVMANPPHRGRTGQPSEQYSDVPPFATDYAVATAGLLYAFVRTRRVSRRPAFMNAPHSRVLRNWR